MAAARLVTVALALIFAFAGPSSGAVNPTLYVKYTMNCTFGITDDGGKAVSSVLPGTYSLEVSTPVVFGGVDLSGIYDMTACKGFVQFQLTGPGVDVHTTLEDGDSSYRLDTVILKASSTYTAIDLNQPSVARGSFTTAATGSAGQVANPASSGDGKSSGSAGSTSGSIIGSASNPLRGSLVATVSKVGAVTLKRNGKTVTSLKSGRWTFQVADQSKAAGFTLKALHGKATTVSSTAFVGSSKTTISLAQGRWYFYSPGGKQSQFFVLS